LSGAVGLVAEDGFVPAGGLISEIGTVVSAGGGEGMAATAAEISVSSRSRSLEMSRRNVQTPRATTPQVSTSGITLSLYRHKAWQGVRCAVAQGDDNLLRKAFGHSLRRVPDTSGGLLMLCDRGRVLRYCARRKPTDGDPLAFSGYTIAAQHVRAPLFARCAGVCLTHALILAHNPPAEE
jgi:hypothetical protein